MRVVATAVFLYATLSCAAPSATPVPAPAPAPAGDTTAAVGATADATADSAALERLREATSPIDPLQITFNWSLQDRDFRLSGRGVVRMQAPYLARLDLFGPQDVLFVKAVLNGSDLQLVAAGPNVPIPPQAFLWGVLGVFRAPDAPRTSMTRDGGTLTFGYGDGKANWSFRADTTALRFAEWRGEDGGRRTVELSGPFRFARPARAVFRDWREFRELTLNVTEIEKVEPFAADIWNVSDN